MPLTKVDYKKAVIYRIYCLDNNITDCYIGLTTDFIRRKYQHKHGSQLKDSKLYSCIKEHGGWENWNTSVRGRCKIAPFEKGAGPATNGPAK